MAKFFSKKDYTGEIEKFTGMLKDGGLSVSKSTTAPKRVILNGDPKRVFDKR